VQHRLTVWIGCALIAAIAHTSAQGAIVVTNNVDANQLGAALGLGPGAVITSSNLAEVQQIPGLGLASSGVFKTTGPAPDTYGLDCDGIVLTTGNAADFGTGPDSKVLSVNYKTGTFAYDSLLDPIATPFGWGGYSFHDFTKLDLTFDMVGNADTISFKLVFGTDQAPLPANDYFFNDVFAAFLNGTNIALVDGKPMEMHHPDLLPSSSVNNPGTAMSWVLAPGGNPILEITAKVAPGSKNNTLSFIIADNKDGYMDSGVFICGVPEPQTFVLALAALPLGALYLLRRRRV